ERVLQASTPDTGLLRRLLAAIAESERGFDAPLDPVGQQAPGEPIEAAAASGPDAGSEAAPASVARGDVDQTTRIAAEVIDTQIEMLSVDCAPELRTGRLASAITATERACLAVGATTAAQTVGDAREQLLAGCAIDAFVELAGTLRQGLLAANDDDEVPLETEPSPVAMDGDEPKVERAEARESNASERGGARPLKVDPARIDSLMDLVGELVVAKNALPFLAAKAENVYQMRELGRDIRSQYSIINRLAEELQYAVMQVRMVPVGVAFQRLPRLVRDLSRRLGKQVVLDIHGEDTEADKTVVEELAEPLMHLVRNSLDHGIETMEARVAAGKPAEARIEIRAAQRDDKVTIEIHDDGGGIDPAVIKRKAYQKGLLSEEALDTVSDDAVLQLIFAPGFSTAGNISDISGRGVGMDVVRTTVTKVGGQVGVQSTVGVGTTISLSLPLSMAVTQVMSIRVGGQLFGVPFDLVRETVRVPRASIHRVKHREAVVLRERLLPLLRLQDLLEIEVDPEQTCEPQEVAVLVVQVAGENVGIIVDDFDDVTDLIVKPMAGVLSRFTTYGGTALLGDGRVLLLLNLREIVRCQ
ncbi:MAG: chemotaxis protein CheA, partial [Gammaproteobacteria bacterium]|nr:chemotaxis protein CheA [Gammaproteobacteria bacterium]